MDKRTKRRRAMYKAKANRVLQPPMINQGTVLPKTLNTVFPDFLRTSLVTTFTTAFNNATTPLINIFHANDVLRVGPATAFTGLTSTSFANNVPSGLTFLLSNNVVNTGATSPYNKYRVIASAIRVQWLGLTSVAASTVFEGTRLSVFPHTTDALSNYNHTSLSSLSTNNIIEQPLCKSILSPHVQSTKPIIIDHYQTTLKQLGFRYPSSLESVSGLSGAISGSSTYDPPDYIYDWIVRVASSDDSATVTGDLTITITHDVELFGRNSYTSATLT
jgi:hypothetical protein